MSKRVPSNLKEQKGNLPPRLWQVFFKVVILKVFRCCVYSPNSIRLPCSIYPGRFGKHAREAWLLLLVSCSTKIYHLSVEWWKTTNCPGRDAKRLVILKGDFESGEEKGGGQMKEEIARKYSAYFQSILHHNNGYFLTVSASLSYSEASNGRPRRNVLIAAALSEFPLPGKLSDYAPRANWGCYTCLEYWCILGGTIDQAFWTAMILRHKKGKDTKDNISPLGMINRH